jgi:hypothetical protein
MINISKGKVITSSLIAIYALLVIELFISLLAAALTGLEVIPSEMHSYIFKALFGILALVMSLMVLIFTVAIKDLLERFDEVWNEWYK